jgi:hypothetical protein
MSIRLRNLEKFWKFLKLVFFQVLINDSNPSTPFAYGVTFRRHNGIPQIALANREVILSAGAFVSPLILIRSGIGPRKILEEAKVTTVYFKIPGKLYILLF